MPSVIVDDREPPRIAERLAALGLTVATSRLEAGDYQFFPHGLNVLIERKTISDLLGSLSDRRIVAQAHRMVASANLCILLREGAFRKGPTQMVEYYQPRHPEADGTGWVRTGWAWASFQGMMFDLKLMGLLVWDTYDLGEAANDIAIIVESLHKDEHRWIRERERPDIITADKQYRNAVWALCAFDGIGPKVATALLKGRNFYEVIDTAARQETVGVDGFGKARAATLQEEVLRYYG